MYNEQLSREALQLGFNTEINLYSNLFTYVNVRCIVYVYVCDNHCVCHCVCKIVCLNCVSSCLCMFSLNSVSHCSYK